MNLLSKSHIYQLLSYFNQGDYRATEHYARALVIQYPNSGFAWKVLGVALRYQGQIATSLLPSQKAAELLPDDAEAHSNLGVTLMNLGRLVEAVHSYRNALMVNPDYVDVHHHLGLTLATLGHHAEAESCYLRVLTLKPDYPDALYNLGCVLQEQGRLAEAEQCYRRVLVTHTDTANVYSHLARVLHWQSCFDEAERYYRQALELNSHDVKAHSHLGLLLHNQGRLQEAKQCYQNALAIQPDFAELQNNLGIVLHELGLETEAEACYQHALAIKPDYANAYNNLGLSLQAQGRLSEAETAYRNALAINPNNSEVYNNLGIVFQERGQQLEAHASYQRALVIKPNDAQVQQNLGMFYQTLGLFDEAESCFKNTLAIKPDNHIAHSQLILAMNQNAKHTASDCLAQAQQYGLNIQVATPFKSWLCPAQPERLRIGMVIGDVSAQDIDLFLADLLPSLDSSCLELIAYCTHRHATVLKPYFATWHTLNELSDSAVAHLIHADGVHILLDLIGHHHHNRLAVFAWQAAPIQVNWLGTLTSSGLAQMTYLLGDTYMTEAGVFSETIWQLPETYRCFTVPNASLTPNNLPVLTNNFLCFANFAELHKINDKVIGLWAQILHAVPHSYLLLKNHALHDTENCQRVQQRFAEQGILPERLVLEAADNEEQQLAAYHRVDIVLDTFPESNRHLSALWMGVPIITLAGDRPLARCSASILANIGLDNWLAENEADYLEKAVYFAWDIATLENLRSNLRQQLLDSPLLNITHFARHFEAALWSMYQQ